MMKAVRPAILLMAVLAATLVAPSAAIADALVVVESESGSLGTNFLAGNSSGTVYISNTNNNTASTPGIVGRVASYNVTFPEAGTYDLYARIRVGPGMANDDSFLYANGFGAKSLGSTADWVLCNNLWNVGYTNPADAVAGGGTIQIGV